MFLCLQAIQSCFHTRGLSWSHAICIIKYFPGDSHLQFSLETTACICRASDTSSMAAMPDHLPLGLSYNREDCFGYGR